MEPIIFAVCVIGVPLIALVGFIVLLIKFIKLRKTTTRIRKSMS